MLLSSNSFGQESNLEVPVLEEVNVINESDLLSKVKSLSKVPYTDFIKELAKVNELTQKFINSRSEECSGTFSEVSINEKGERIVKKKRLDKKERNHCLYMLVTFRMKLVESIYSTRKTHLKALQATQSEELNKSEKLRLGTLQKLARKYKK
jgi:hypothetical protein